MVTSAVTASLVQNKPKYKGIAGTKRMEYTNNGLTCVPDFDGFPSCTFTMETTTTYTQDDSVTGPNNDRQTRHNTSIIEIIDIEPTSLVE